MSKGAGLRPVKTIAPQDWMTSAPAKKLLAALEDGRNKTEGPAALFVGGCVRNALLGLPVEDVDIATPLPPETVTERCTAKGITIIPTGIKHGTVTALIDGTHFEITTLRRDLETDGRRAEVGFTESWIEDAQRRDFTMNTLLADQAGKIFDPTGQGIDDLEARRIRFVGEPAQRIAEDYLRILRFFRFTADYADGPPDAAGLAASIALAPGLAGLSAERIRAELLRLLAAPRAVEIVTVMADAGLLAPLLGLPPDVALFGRLAAIEASLGGRPDPLLRLAALAAPRPGPPASTLASRLRLSNAEAERLARLALPADAACHPDTAEQEARAYLYRFGADAFRDGVTMAWARSAAAPDCSRWRGRFVLPNRWKTPVLPVRGADLVAAGLAEGPAVGRILRAFEDWWIAADFPRDEMLLARTLSDFVKANRP